MDSIDLKTVNYSGHVFADFFVDRSPNDGPGFYVYGRNAEKYGRHDDGRGAYIMLCARPNVKARRSPNYNGPVRRGWHTRREAQSVADILNAK